MEFILLVGSLVILVFGTLTAFARRYRRCPSDKILVVYGKIAGGSTGLSARCYHGGASFVWPIIQDYQFLDLTPIPIEMPTVKVEGVLTRMFCWESAPSSLISMGIGVRSRNW